MRGINKVCLLGGIGKDPESRKTKTGSIVVNASLATTTSFGSGDNKQETTEWVNLVFFGKLAEIVSKYVKKGSKVYVEGRLETQKWQTDTGETRYATKVIGHEILLLDSKPKQSNQSNSNNYDYDDYKGNGNSYNNDNIEDIPF